MVAVAPPPPPPPISVYSGRWRSRQNPHSITALIQRPVPTFSIAPRNLRSVITSFQFPEYPLDSSVYADSIESCSSIHVGRQIHAHTIKSGFVGSREFLETKLLIMYGRTGNHDEDARRLFDLMPLRNIYTWVGIISTYVANRNLNEAIFLFRRLLFESIVLEFFVFPILLKCCGGFRALGLGNQLHGFVLKTGLWSNLYVSNALVDLYGKCLELAGATTVFNQMPERDLISWNSIITACAANGKVFEALEFLTEMEKSSSGNLKPNLISWTAVIGGFSHNEYDDEALSLLLRLQDSGIKPNAQTFASVLPSCARLQLHRTGEEIHGYITRHGFDSNPFVVNGLLDLYRRCHDMKTAMKIFSILPLPNLVSFNAMIVGYCEIGDLHQANDLFDQMDLDGVLRRDVVSWNSMISGYVDDAQYDKAWLMFTYMQVDGINPDSSTLSSLLKSCSNMSDLIRGQALHSVTITRGLQYDTFVGGALVDMYCKCRDLDSAKLVFEKMSEKDVGTWNALIFGLSRSDQMTSAHKLFARMVINSTPPNIYSLAILLSTCAKSPSIEFGKQAHAYTIRQAWHTDAHIGAPLVDMYAKCGCIRIAERVFSGISCQNLVSYNTMITGFAMHGLAAEAAALFRQLVGDGLNPDSITFLSILSSCTHEGLIEQGFKYFNQMMEFGVAAELKHYTCMVDLLSRSGRICDAYDLIRKMPMNPDAVIWGALLSGCVIHSNVGLGAVVADKLIELDDGNAGNYVMIANLFAGAGRHDDQFGKMRWIMEKKKKEGGLRKIPGYSWIEDRNEVHMFVAGDRSHERAAEIYATMVSLNSHMSVR